jgi:hypothetical protein
MDEFLIPNASFKRLWQEYNKYPQLVVCVDFDNTLYDFHKKGFTYPLVKQLVRDLKRKLNFYVIIWTGNQDIDLVVQYCKDNDIPFDSINEDSPQSMELYRKNGDLPPRKQFANVYLDDRISLEQTYKELELLIWLAELNFF